MGSFDQLRSPPPLDFSTVGVASPKEGDDGLARKISHGSKVTLRNERSISMTEWCQYYLAEHGDSDSFDSRGR